MVILNKYKGIVVSHTHWDREWFLTFQEFRVRLVKLLDELIDVLTTDPEYKSFTMDGQTICINDYLAVRPEKKQIIQELVEKDKLLIGPWYVLADEFLVSGEALIRNLMVGHKIANEFGKVMKVGYVPDAFGHVSQLPSILQGFGIDSMIFTRGMGDAGAELPSEFSWEASSGESVLAIHQVTGYGNFAAIGDKDFDRNWDKKQEIDLKDAVKRTRELLDKMGAKATTPVLAFNNGSDHLLAQTNLAEILDYLNNTIDELELVHGTYYDFLEALRSHQPKLETYRGEMRGARFNNLLPGVLSARMYIKQKNNQVQQLLERYAEPLVSWGNLVGYDYVPELMWEAWRLLIQNHPHDSICGCSVDQVHREMMPRFDQAQQIGTLLASESSNTLVSKIDTSGVEESTQAIVIFNSHNHQFAGTSTCVFDRAEPMGEVCVMDQANQLVASQLAGEWVTIEQGKPQVYRHKLSFAAQVPAGGYRTYYLVEGKTASEKTDLSYGERYLENSLVKVEVNSDGTLEIFHKPTKIRYSKALTMESTEDVGDEYDYAPAKEGATVFGIEQAELSWITKGQQSATIRISGVMNLPKEISQDRQRRSSETIECAISHEVTLHAYNESVEVKTCFNNLARDHRLRVGLPLPDRTDKVYAEGHFDVIQRSTELPSGENWFQPPVGYNSQLTWVSAQQVTLANKGLPEYEVVDRQDGKQLQLTLLRCVGWLSRNDMVTRWDDHAGPGLATPEAQCQGEHVFEYALIPHQGDWEAAKSWQKAHVFNAPPRAVLSSVHQGELPAAGSLSNLSNDNLVISAIRPGQNTNQVVVRAFNPTNQLQEASFTSVLPIESVVELNLNEEEIATVKNNELTWRPKQIRTFLIKFVPDSAGR